MTVIALWQELLSLCQLCRRRRLGCSFGKVLQNQVPLLVDTRWSPVIQQMNTDQRQHNDFYDMLFLSRWTPSHPRIHSLISATQVVSWWFIKSQIKNNSSRQESTRVSIQFKEGSEYSVASLRAPLCSKCSVAFCSHVWNMIWVKDVVWRLLGFRSYDSAPS